MATRGDAMQRAAQAYHLRIVGRTWTEIAAEVGFANDANAIRAVRRFAGRLPDPSPEETRTVWRDRMEHLWSLAARDAETGRPGALRAGVAIADRAARLDGLDAPTRVHVTPGAAELDEIVARLLRMGGVEEIVEADVIELDVIESRRFDESDEDEDDDAAVDDEH